MSGAAAASALAALYECDELRRLREGDQAEQECTLPNVEDDDPVEGLDDMEGPDKRQHGVVVHWRQLEASDSDERPNEKTSFSLTQAMM